MLVVTTTPLHCDSGADYMAIIDTRSGSSTLLDSADARTTNSTLSQATQENKRNVMGLARTPAGPLSQRQQRRKLCLTRHVPETVDQVHPHNIEPRQIIKPNEPRTKNDAS